MLDRKTNSGSQPRQTAPRRKNLITHNLLFFLFIRFSFFFFSLFFDRLPLFYVKTHLVATNSSLLCCCEKQPNKNRHLTSSSYSSVYFDDDDTPHYNWKIITKTPSNWATTTPDQGVAQGLLGERQMPDSARRMVRLDHALQSHLSQVRRHQPNALSPDEVCCVPCCTM